MAETEKPFPPGTYPVVVVGSGPGGLQTSYCLKRVGVKHAVISADDAPGGMFLRFPIFQRLISWTKLHAPVDRGARDYERYDWNSLIGDSPKLGGLVADQMEGKIYFPSRAEMQAGLAAFATKARIRVRWNCEWQSTRHEDGCFVVSTSDGEFKCKVLIVATGMTEPWKPQIPGLEAAPHYAETRFPKEYSGKSVFIVGKRNSAFELADGILAYAKQMFLASPRPPSISLMSFHVASARARYLQVYEDYVLGGGSVILDAAIQRVERHANGYTVHAAGTTKPGDLRFDVDEVIAATGFTTPLGDLRELGVATFNQDRLPAMTNYWESASVPGIYFAGSVSQGAVGLKKHGIPGVSGAVQGMRYNAKVLAEFVAQKHFGIVPSKPRVQVGDLGRFILGEATHSPVLWVQKSYLARSVTFDGNGVIDDGIVPLAEFVDAAGSDALAVVVETGPTGDIYPVVYVRTRGGVQEHVFPSNYLHDFEGPEHAAQLESILKIVQQAR
ncbi:MAG TPA: NAD(P)-binding domain-containing protein [Actinomycetota bacterium]|nr:NAD(P)-binding domain-containing protein [Actinomycetota bacterium]